MDDTTPADQAAAELTAELDQAERLRSYVTIHRDIARVVLADWKRLKDERAGWRSIADVDRIEADRDAAWQRVGEMEAELTALRKLVNGATFEYAASHIRVRSGSQCLHDATSPEEARRLGSGNGWTTVRRLVGPWTRADAGGSDDTGTGEG